MSSWVRRAFGIRLKRESSCSRVGQRDDMMEERRWVAGAFLPGIVTAVDPQYQPRSTPAQLHDPTMGAFMTFQPGCL